MSAREPAKVWEVTYNSGNGKALLLGIFEKVEDVIANNDAGLAGEYVFGTHVRA